MEPLLPCPFCGGAAVLRGSPSHAYVQCIECHASSGARYQYRRVSISTDDWNRRADGAETARLRVELTLMRAFVRDMFDAADWPEGGDIDMFDFQDAAEKRGILTRERMAEPCGDGCSCAEMGAEFPTDCMRKAEWLRAAGVAIGEEAE